MKVLLLVLVGLSLLIAGALVVIVQPFAGKGPRWEGLPADPAWLQRLVHELVALGRRDDEAGMARTAEFVQARLRELLIDSTTQDYRFDNGTYRNVIVELGPATAQRLVIGAHYDVRGPFPGADDNASGTAGLLELARLFKARPPPLHVELVFYPREEVNGMGSAEHARSLRPEEVRAMVVLEMIGCFDHRQKFPFPQMQRIYPAQGDYIVVVGRPRDFALVRTLKRGIASSGLPVESINAPESVPGIGFSDHRNYWRRGITAAMITDTAWYRNPRYHTARDTPDTLDYARMALVVEGVAAAVSAIPR